MTPIKIGFLTPYSGIYPEMSNHIIHGLLLPFVKYNSQGKQLFALEPEFIKQGDAQSVKDAINKLLYFKQVDVISGVISYYNVPEIIPAIEKREKMAFFFDSGEYIPHTPQISPYIFYNSFQLWQTEYALGYWSQKEFGSKGSIVMGLYDGGYHMHSAFRQGVVKASGNEIDYTVIGEPGHEAIFKHQVDAYLQQMEKNKPSYIHALFCGQEAIQFMARYQESKLCKEVPLIVSNHMASEEILEPLERLGTEIYSASIWNYKDVRKPNQDFVKSFQQATGVRPNLFNLLGYEAGLMFREMTGYFEKRDWENIRKTLQKKSIKGPRGLVNFYPKSGFDLPSIDIEKVRFDKNKITKMVVSQGVGLKYDHAVFEEIHRESVSGWQNPYFCV